MPAGLSMALPDRYSAPRSSLWMGEVLTTPSAASTILAKLRDTVPSLLPFSRAMYARTSTYLWWDDEGRVHDIAQAEGVERGAGVEANLGKTRVFNAAGGDAPPGVDVLGPDVWCRHLPPEQRGFVALGVPIGRLTWKLVQLPDVQCAWLLLAFCKAPRAQHLLRNVPPADILQYARGHDDAVWAVAEGLLGDQGPGEGDDWASARQAARKLAAEGWTLAHAAPTRRPLRVNSAYESQVGSDTPFSHFTLPFANACYFQPWLRPLAPSSTLSPVRTLVCGLRQFLRTQRPPLHRPDARRHEAPPLPLTALHCGAEGRHGCGAEVDAYGDHHLACPRTGLLPRRGFVVERA
eukprot:s1788_g5.t1